MRLIAQLRSRIRYKIIGPFLVLALLTALVGSAVTFSLVANSWQERLNNQLAATTRLANDTLVEQETTNLQFLRLIAFAGENAETGAPAVAAALAEQNRMGLQQAVEPFFLVGINDPNVQLDRLIVFDQGSETLVDMERPPDAQIGLTEYITHASLNLSDVPFVKQVLASSPGDSTDKFTGLVALPDADANLEIYLCTFVPVRPGEQTAVVGGAVMGMRLDSLLDILRQRSQAAIVTLHTLKGAPVASTILPGMALTTGQGSYFDHLPELQTTPSAPAEATSVPEATDGSGSAMPVDDDGLSATSVAEVLQVSEQNLELLKDATGVTILKDRPVVDTVTIDMREYRILYTYLVVRGARVGVLSTGLSTDYVVRGWADTRLPVLALTIVVMLAIIGVGLVTARQVSKPLEKLVTTATAFVTSSVRQRSNQSTSGDIEAVTDREHKPWQDEIEKLSSSFDRMVRNQRVLILKILSESSQRAAILESIPDGIVVCDASGRVSSMNPATRRLLGLSEEDALPEHFSDVPLQPVTDPVFGSHQSDLYMLHESIIRVLRSPIFVANKTYVGDVYVLQDITAEANIDRARTNFTATISHEMRTPLTVLQGNAQLLLQGILGKLDERQQDVVQKMNTHAQTMTRFLSNAIMVAEIDSGAVTITPRATSLREAVEGAVYLLRKAIEQKGLTLCVDIADDVPQVLVDAHMFSQIIEHLVHNAYTYTETGGITLRAFKQGLYIQIDVSDSGCGIASGLLERVFERFVRGEGTESNERAVRGSGLGLTIARQLVELHGGKIWISSEVGRGTTVSLTLPHTASPEIRLEAPEMPQDGLVGGALSAMNGTDGQLSVTDADALHRLPIQVSFHASLHTNGSGRLPLFTIPTMMSSLADALWSQTQAVSVVHQALQAESLLLDQLQHQELAAVMAHMDKLAPHQFQHVLFELLPLLHQRWQLRTRPRPQLLTWARRRFTTVLSTDYVTVDALLRRLGLLSCDEAYVQAGRVAVLVDVFNQLPHALWYEEHSRIYNENLFYERIDGSLEQDMLLICTMDVRSCRFFDRLTHRGVWFISRAPRTMSYEVVQVVQDMPHLRDQVIWLKLGERACTQPVRMVEVMRQGGWCRYLTNMSDPLRLPADYVTGLYDQYQGIEHVFRMVHELLVETHGPYSMDLWKISPAGIQVQVWSIWVLYAMLIDITDAVAEQLQQPAGTLSPKAIYRELYHFDQNTSHEQAMDPVMYLATNTHDAELLIQ